MPDTKDGLCLKSYLGKWLGVDTGGIMKIRVDCYSGYRGEETPRRFWLEERLVEVKEVVDRWLDPEHRYFKVLGDDHSTYILRHDSVAFEWELTFYRREKTQKRNRDMTRNNILFTGPSGCGKTTLIKKIAEQLLTPSTGFFTQEIRENGKRVGFTINTLDGKEALLAHINVSGQYRVGRYGVVLESIESVAVPSMIPMNMNESVVIDEIGKMECFSSLFKKTVLDVLDMPNVVIGTISLRGDQFIKKIKSRSDVLVVEVSEKNRDDLPNTYDKLLK